jgi:hypothetical protein
MDITIVLLPAFPVSKMQLPQAQKYAVIGLFACGIMYDAPPLPLFLNVSTYASFKY